MAAVVKSADVGAKMKKKVDKNVKTQTIKLNVDVKKATSVNTRAQAKINKKVAADVKSSTIKVDDVSNAGADVIESMGSDAKVTDNSSKIGEKVSEAVESPSIKVDDVSNTVVDVNENKSADAKSTDGTGEKMAADVKSTTLKPNVTESKGAVPKSVNSRVDERINKWGQTALHLAAKCNNLKLVESLLAAGANVNARDKMNRTPLHLASEKNRLDSHVYTIEALVKKGASFFAINNSGRTCLQDLLGM